MSLVLLVSGVGLLDAHPHGQTCPSYLCMFVLPLFPKDCQQDDPTLTREVERDSLGEPAKVEPEFEETIFE
jgi:hypothetical protein